MKNIHVLPTPTKVSRLYYHTELKQLVLTNKTMLREFVINQNIYITSDEEIKDGDYYLYLKDNSVHKFIYKHHIKLLRLDIQKKIILTTDQDLIKDGVQAIDDEFLEWFVKNPSCEKVEVEEEDYSQKCRECGETIKRGYVCNRGCSMKSGNFISTDKNIIYKIIIPKEEIKLEDVFNDEKRKGIKALIDMMKGDEELGLYEETLEEAVELFFRKKDVKNCTLYKAAKFGAKWQAERMYSEEDLGNSFLGCWIGNVPEGTECKVSFKEWFKNYKKK